MPSVYLIFSYLRIAKKHRHDSCAISSRPAWKVKRKIVALTDSIAPSLHVSRQQPTEITLYKGGFIIQMILRTFGHSFEQRLPDRILGVLPQTIFIFPSRRRKGQRFGQSPFRRGAEVVIGKLFQRVGFLHHSGCVKNR